MPDDELERRDYEALLATRGELGPDYDKALVDSFADRMEKEIQRRVAATSGGRSIGAEGAPRRPASVSWRSASSPWVSASPSRRSQPAIADLPGLIVAWTGIAAVNVAHALQNRRRD